MGVSEGEPLPEALLTVALLLLMPREDFDALLRGDDGDGDGEGDGGDGGEGREGKASSEGGNSRADMAAGGAAILVISQDLEELMAISTNFAVIAEGRLSEPKATGSQTIEEIGLLMGGVHDSIGSVDQGAPT